MKKFFAEFKKFITRGNVLDMAVGVIVGGAFTGIVNGLSNYVLKPLINALLAVILGSEGLDGAVTMLSAAYTETGAIDLAKSIYIDWGAFISSIINFLLIAITLFTIVKVINSIREKNEKISAKIKKRKLTKEQKKELKQRGIKLYDRDKVEAYLAEKEAEKKAQEEQEKKELEEKAKADRLANPTVEDLLKQIKEILQAK